MLSLLLQLGIASATALTFVLGPNQQECFYTINAKPSNIGYYFAVQAGGSFDIDYTIKSPSQQIIVSEEAQRQGDYLFAAEEIGEYEFCFSNPMSTYTDKVVDFEIRVEDEELEEYKASLPDAPKENVQLDGIQQSVAIIEEKLDALSADINKYKTRTNRNQSTVQSTEGRILWFTFFDLVIMLAMAVFQIGVVKYFFQGSRKQLV
ncbi:Erp3 protein [Martiniozyma asiatica (nom. inval.)]|nr:Erp3 protein [Martiniozyma asiatica]